MIEATRDRAEQEFTVETPAGVRLHCRRWGDSPRVVVAVHGMNAHALHWRKLAERLLPDHQLVSYDLRGHGESQKPVRGYSHADYADDLAAVIAHAAPTPPVLIGHSLGGRIAIPYAAGHPLRAFVVIDPGIVPVDAMHPPPNGAPPARSRPALQHEFESEAAFMERMRRTNFLRNWHAYNEEYARNLIEPNENGGVHLKFRPYVHEQTIEGIRSTDLFAYLRDITCPTLVIRATEGHLRADMAERIVDALPDARLAVVEGSNHNVMLDKPDQFEPLIEDFLRQVYRD